MVHLGSTY
ncbi:hypothetical protein Pint_07197 [Pistacia integerrima]|uniref:Uncharacterized protein n=1 Tax=Pistacia integerrima TaxID=434235 RepID=A0ACC0XZW9_9ROSI|nr:hypothetical protein Pint_07197 [Pistacia integerrima]